MQKTKKRSVIGIVFSDLQKQVLLIKRRDVPIWVLPGGGIDENETPEHAVIREVLEETGLQVGIKRQVAFYTPVNNLANDTYVFECERISGNLVTGDETSNLGFFPITTPPQPNFFLHLEWIADALKNQSEVIEKPLTQVTYWNLFKYFCRNPLQVIRFLLSLFGRPFNSK